MMTNESMSPPSEGGEGLVERKPSATPPGENGRIQKAAAAAVAAAAGGGIKRLQDEIRTEGKSLPPVPPLVRTSPVGGQHQPQLSPADESLTFPSKSGAVSQAGGAATDSPPTHSVIYSPQEDVRGGGVGVGGRQQQQQRPLQRRADDRLSNAAGKRASPAAAAAADGLDQSHGGAKRSRKSSSESSSSLGGALAGLSPETRAIIAASPAMAAAVADGRGSIGGTGFAFDPALYERAHSTPSYKLHGGNAHKIGAYTLKAELRKLERMFTCNICDRSFGYKHVLQKHQRIHSGEKPFECKECSKRFTQEHHLKTHMRTHTGERPYACELCPRTFAQVANLRRHNRVHTGEKPYECEVCSKRFPSSGHVKKHMRIHTGEKPYLCDICQQNFRLHHHLMDHKRIHTGEKPYHCGECKRNFSTQRGLQQHHHDSPARTPTQVSPATPTSTPLLQSTPVIKSTGVKAKKLHAVVSKLAAEKLGKMALKMASPSPSPPSVSSRLPAEMMAPLLPGLNPAALHGSFFYHGLPTQQIKIPSLLSSPMHGLPVRLSPFFNPYLVPATLAGRMPLHLPPPPLPRLPLYHLSSDNSDSEEGLGEVSSRSDDSELEEGEVRRPRAHRHRGRSWNGRGGGGGGGGGEGGGGGGTPPDTARTPLLQSQPECSAIDYSMKRLRQTEEEAGERGRRGEATREETAAAEEGPGTSLLRQGAPLMIRSAEDFSLEFKALSGTKK